ncbi:hypothetical protein ACFS6H_08150 [Terrimonas rubra]|uniref:YD repeat-containing protein n=1 Tax=Terrimonas rubra TaxID=1035890 RepID=A0ABW6A7J0_9BACT
MKYLFLFIVFLYQQNTFGQYYYRDIVTTGENNVAIASLFNNKVTNITATEYNNRGQKNTDFNDWQDINHRDRIIRQTTRDRLTKTTVYTRVDEQFRVVDIADTSGGIINNIQYRYNNKNQVTAITKHIFEPALNTNQTEVFTWEYASDGLPLTMKRIINKTDTTEYRFARDEQGNIGEERQYRLNLPFGQPLYYYYDDKNRLTDIVRYNTRIKMLMPELMFEYDENNRVIQKTQVVSSVTRDYIIWRYIFNNAGLKTKEVLFDKNKDQTGRIDYQYQFAE